MSDRRGLKQRLLLYGITPDAIETVEELSGAITAAAQGGLTAVQYRHKGSRSREQHERMARAVVEVADELGILSIVNDDPVLAEAVGADGVHLGVGDSDISAVRARFGAERIIGASAPSLAHARSAVRAGADYLGVGAIFDARASKANASAARGVRWLEQFRDDPELAGIPIVAIGGISALNARACLAHGADGVASIRAVFGGESVEDSTQRLARALSQD